MSLLALKKYLPHILLALLGLLLAWPAMAASTDNLTDGQIAQQLSEELICDAFHVVSGNLGLMAGFLLAAWGLYIWIRKDAMKTALIYIVCGALLTAVPGFVFATMRGLGFFLGPSASNVSDRKAEDIKMPNCGFKTGGGF